MIYQHPLLRKTMTTQDTMRLRFDLLITSPVEDDLYIEETIDVGDLVNYVEEWDMLTETQKSELLIGYVTTHLVQYSVNTYDDLIIIYYWSDLCNGVFHCEEHYMMSEINYLMEGFNELPDYKQYAELLALAEGELFDTFITCSCDIYLAD